MVGLYYEKITKLTWLFIIDWNEFFCSLLEKEIHWLILIFGIIVLITSVCQLEENEAHLPQTILEIKRRKCLIGKAYDSYYSVFLKWEFFLLFLHLFNRITSLSFQQIKKKASKKSDFVILLCSIAHPVPGNVCTYSQNTGNLLQYFMNCKDWNALQCRILLHTLSDVEKICFHHG